MFEKDMAKLEFALEMITEIETYKVKYASIEEMFEDRMCYNAVLMNLLQIGESLNKLSVDIKLKYEKILPIKSTYDTRNFIAHDYGGVRIDIIKDITVLHLAELKESIMKILDIELIPIKKVIELRGFLKEIDTTIDSEEHRV